MQQGHDILDKVSGTGQSKHEFKDNSGTGELRRKMWGTTAGEHSQDRKETAGRMANMT